MKGKESEMNAKGRKNEIVNLSCFCSSDKRRERFYVIQINSR